MSETQAEYKTWAGAICPKCGSDAAVALPYTSMGYLTGDAVLCYKCGVVSLAREQKSEEKQS